VHNSVRQSVSLPARIAKRVLALAETKKISASRVLVDLIETGIHAKKAQHQRFFEITDQLAATTDPRRTQAPARGTSPHDLRRVGSGRRLLTLILEGGGRLSIYAIRPSNG